MKLLSIALLLSACATTPRLATPTTPFACRGDAVRAPAPPREGIMAPDPRPARRLEVERIGEDIRLVADDAPLGEVAIALGAAVGMDVLVDPELVGRRVNVDSKWPSVPNDVSSEPSPPSACAVHEAAPCYEMCSD